VAETSWRDHGGRCTTDLRPSVELGKVGLSAERAPETRNKGGHHDSIGDMSPEVLTQWSELPRYRCKQ
jgi:hypothetical protein